MKGTSAPEWRWKASENRMMDTKQTLAALGALAQETRLEIFRLLVQRGPEGLAAGAIAEALHVAAPTLSFHLQQLMHAGLIEQRRESRSLIYSANFGAMRGLVAYLTENCCGRGASLGSTCATPAVVETEVPLARRARQR